MLITTHLSSDISPSFRQCAQRLEEQVARGLFTAWSIANNDGCLSCFWPDEHATNSSTPTVHPEFDLASLTKPLFLNLLLRFAWGEQFLERVTVPLDVLLPKEKAFFSPRIMANSTLDTFLSHRSGLPPWFWMGQALWQGNQPKRRRLNPDAEDFKQRFQANLTSIACSLLPTERGQETLSRCVYSDINYLLLARLYEVLSGDKQNKAFAKDVFARNLNSLNSALATGFQHASLVSTNDAVCVPSFPYRVCEKNRATSVSPLLRFGLVHDTNANILSSFSPKKNIVSGHAGLFGSVVDVARATQFLAKQQAQAMGQAVKQRISFAGQRFVLGLDTPSSPSSVAGLRHHDTNRDQVFGHLGYTGTSFWFLSQKDPEQASEMADESKTPFHVLLTNRTAHRTAFSHCAKDHPSEEKNRQNARLLVFSKKTDENASLFFRVSAQESKEITAPQFFSILRDCKKQTSLAWDKDYLRFVPDISEIRKTVAYALWNV